MRALLEQIDAARLSKQWRRPGAALDSLIQLVLRLQSFDDTTHRPKGVELIAALRGREQATDSLIGRLEVDCQQRDDMLNQALAQLRLLQNGQQGAATRAHHFLEQYGAVLRSDLDIEDSALHAESTKLLSPEQWSAVASSVSSAIRTDRRRNPSPDESSD
jgi:hemerythrin-like domain-containing protein